MVHSLSKEDKSKSTKLSEMPCHMYHIQFCISPILKPRKETWSWSSSGEPNNLQLHITIQTNTYHGQQSPQIVDDNLFLVHEHSCNTRSTTCNLQWAHLRYQMHAAAKVPALQTKLLSLGWLPDSMHQTQMWAVHKVAQVSIMPKEVCLSSKVSVARL